MQKQSDGEESKSAICAMQDANVSVPYSEHENI